MRLLTGAAHRAAALFVSALTALTLVMPVLLAATPAGAQQMTLEQVGPTLAHPWGMEFLTSDTVLVTTRSGALWKIGLADGAATRITGAPDVFARRQGGLLDVAAIDGHVYLCYSAVLPGGSATAIDRAVIEGDRLVRRRTIFTGNAATKSGHHFGCRLHVTGTALWATLGDRGERDNGQDPSTHAASIIRLTPDGAPHPGNPHFTDSGKAGWAPEIFSIGHRNPQGLAMHPATGEMWAHEHGPRGGDEINILRPATDAGANYGWPAVSHGREYATGMRVSRHDSLPGFVDPVWVWTPSIAPSGMAFYPGASGGAMVPGTMIPEVSFPEWRGHLLVGSLKFRRLYLVEIGETGLPVAETIILDGEIGRIRDVAVGPDGPFAGEVFLLSDESQGGLWRLSAR
ncbi:MAG: PQQ-dependent sugar dehydrogenase [Candidatus Puniceispirillaceae bacterium]|jgi:glucose/arabinose dehydrogenase